MATGPVLFAAKPARVVQAVEDFAHCPLGKLGQAVTPLRRPTLARMARQEPGRPQLMRIAKLLRVATSEVHQPCPRRGCSGGLLAGSWPIIERFQWTIGNGPLDATLDRLMLHAESLTPRRKRTGLRDKPEAFAPARHGLPAPFATSLSPASAASPPLRWPIPIPDATPTRLFTSLSQTRTRQQNGNPQQKPQACYRIHGIGRLV